MIGQEKIMSLFKRWSNLGIESYIVVFDGYGYAHPRRVGLATHASFFINKPTFGIAKTQFVGEYVEPKNIIGDSSSIIYENEIVGVSLRTKLTSKPVYLSIGNRITLDEVIAISKKFIISNSRIPLLTFLPDKLTKKLKNLLI